MPGPCVPTSVSANLCPLCKTLPTIQQHAELAAWEGLAAMRASSQAPAMNQLSLGYSAEGYTQSHVCILPSQAA